jgi:taurine dioxygenase
MIASPLRVKPVTTNIGAEILDIDLSAPIDEATFAQIRATYFERGVIFFRGQTLDDDEFQAFGRRFGGLTQSRLYPHKVAGHDDLQVILKEAGSNANNGGIWHSDQSFRKHPIMGTGLIARKVPPSGGDTAFTNMSAAFDALSDGLKHTLRGMRAFHTNDTPKQSLRRAELNAGKPESEHIKPDEAIHPVVLRHPETGREVLYVNEHYTVRFDGWTKAESEPLLRYLFAHSLRPEFGCRFTYEVGSMAIWDNRTVLHYAVNDYPGGERVLHRFMCEGPFLR